MQKDNPPMDSNDERRRYFRIEDSVRLSLREVEEEELDQRLEKLEDRMIDSFSLMTGLNSIGQQVSASLRRIETKDPDIADYLKALDKKLDLICKALLAEETHMMETPARAVNLSAGGMAVYGRDAMRPGKVLEIKMLLLPSYTGILTYGTLVDCVKMEGEEADPEFPYRLRIDFSFMRDTDRDALIRHVLLKQAEWLRRRREERENRL